MRVSVEHGLENGRLVVWIDGVVAFETKLQAPVSKKIVAIKVRERSRRKGAAGGGEGSKRKRNAPAAVRQHIQDTNVPPPDWLQRVSADPPEGKVVRLPMRQDVDPRIKDDVREQL